MQITDEMLYQYAPEARDVWLSTRLQREEVTDFPVSRNFEHRMKKLLRQQRRPWKLNRVLSAAKRTAAVAMVVLTISFAGLMTVDAYREKVIEAIVQVFHELTEYRFYTEEPEIVIPGVSFGYIPEGMREVERNITQGKRSFYRYETENGEFFELRQSGISANGSYVRILDTEDACVEDVSLNGREVTIIEKTGSNMILWDDENIVYELYGNVSMDELKEILKNLKIFSY